MSYNQYKQNKYFSTITHIRQSQIRKSEMSVEKSTTSLNRDFWDLWDCWDLN